MSDAVIEDRTPIAAALDHLRAAVEELLTVPLSAATRDELVALTGGVEQQTRRLPTFWHQLIGELTERAVPADLAMRDTATMLARQLRLDPAEARARVAAAGELGHRRAITGERLEPLFPTVAAAQAAGEISPAHARVITAGLDAVPAGVGPEQAAALEASWVTGARHADPRSLDRQIRLALERLDPDGPEPDDRAHQRKREVHLRRNSDGSGELKGHLTPITATTWTAILDALSAPAPASDGTPDDRSAAQRRHDGLLDAGQRLLRSADLPDAGGTPVTVLVRINAEDLRTGRGYAHTEHGDLITVQEIIAHAGDGALIPVLLDPTGGIISYGRARRLACPAQRRALAARDGGCSFPPCTTPASWCQTHHVREWADGGTTDLSNMTLVCGYHHREFARRGWECLMINGVPHWRPPAWIDPDRQPRRNTAHHAELWYDPPPVDPPPTDQPHPSPGQARPPEPSPAALTREEAPPAGPTRDEPTRDEPNRLTRYRSARSRQVRHEPAVRRQ